MTTKCPFIVNGEIHCNIRAIRDVCVVWPIPPESKIGSIEIPDCVRENKGIGILLSVGPGYWSNDGVHHKTNDCLIPGIMVSYDKTVPWRAHCKDASGTNHVVVLCGEQDINGVLI